MHRVQSMSPLTNVSHHCSHIRLAAAVICRAAAHCAQNSVRIEVAAAVEPLKQLPQLVAAAAAKAAAQQQQQQQQAADYDGATAAGGMPSSSSSSSAAAAVDQSLLVEQLRELVAAEVATATQQILNQQVRLGSGFFHMLLGAVNVVMPVLVELLLSGHCHTAGREPAVAPGLWLECTNVCWCEQQVSRVCNRMTVCLVHEASACKRLTVCGSSTPHAG
jgi:hypothetical protein